MDKTESRETWNKKRVIFAFIIFILLGTAIILFKDSVLGLNKKFSLKSVMGIDTKREEKAKNSSSNSKSGSLQIKAAIQEKLDTIKKDINNLNIVNIASSSPQVQKIINDLNSLRNYPKHEVKDICQKICGGL